MTPSFFSTPIEFLKGVGPQRAELFQKELQIFTFGDLVAHFPFRYEDRSKFYQIKEINADLPYIQLLGKITAFRMEGEKQGQRLIAKFTDNTGTIDLVWFKGIRWIKNYIKTDIEYIVFGKPNLFNKKINIVHPELELTSDETDGVNSALQAVYSITELLKNKGLTSKAISRLTKTLLEKLPDYFPESLPENIIKQVKLISKRDALLNIHFPQSQQKLKDAELRLKFEELFYMQLNLQKSRVHRLEKFEGHKFEHVAEHFNSFFKNLPFDLTNAQKRVMKEIRADMNNGKQMNRLLQGDVGSGKTLVALMSMLIGIDNGFQACLMAPTEILAQQHFQSISRFCENVNIHIALLTGSTKTAERNTIHENLLSGKTNIIIGTHALIEDMVQFKNLGLVVIDEQHRFGVQQRAKLMGKKSPSPALPEGKGDSLAHGISPFHGEKENRVAPKYQTARESSYHLFKELQEERKRQTTEAEQILWNYLKGKNLEQHKFRRQHIIDEFIIDFACLSKKLIIEVDGKYHEKPEIEKADKLRTQILESLGYKVIRFKNEEVTGNIEAVLKKITDELNSRAREGKAHAENSSSLWGEVGSGASVPHVLVMTATPIPRTLAMTVYGDLDVSVIDELPPGRTPIATFHYTDAARLRIFGFMKEQIKIGRQIFVVYPLIQESEKLDYKNLEEGYEAISRDFPRPPYHLSVVHGRMKAEDKNFEMQRFLKGEAHIMVATSVIEVGVDIPNASVMIIESAERFGLSQLHQLRGRVGRGAEKSYCILVTGHKLSNEAKLRMETMVRTNDGFEISEVDLKLRGHGDLEGTRQSGPLNLKIADLIKDVSIVKLARDLAINTLQEDPHLELEKNKILLTNLNSMSAEAGNWSRIS